MRKRVYGRKFNRSGRSRTAMFRGLVRGLAENGQIRTTEAKAKALQQEMDKLLQLVRKNTLASRRDLLARVGNDVDTVERLFSKYLSLAQSRPSGFTSIKWEGVRRGDNSKIALVEMISAKEEKLAKEKSTPSKETK